MAPARVRPIVEYGRWLLARSTCAFLKVGLDGQFEVLIDHVACAWLAPMCPTHEIYGCMDAVCVISLHADVS